MLDFSEDGMKECPITLQEILDNGRHVPNDDHLNIRDRKNITLYLKAFHLNSGKLDRIYGSGVDAIGAIQNSSTYQGFKCAVEGRECRGDATVDVHSLDYRMGYKTGIKASQQRRRA